MIAFLFLAIVASATGTTKYYDGFSLDDSLSCHVASFPPMDTTEIDTKFYMYTESIPGGVIFSPEAKLRDIKAYGFDPNKDTYFFTHGYLSDSQHPSTLAIYHDWTDKGANVFAVDWRNGAKVANYNYARQNIRVVGNQIAIFVNMLGQSDSKIVLCGHSLGAHTSGYAGEALQTEFGKKVSRITGLDPAGPGFSEQTEPGCRLDPSDADFVDNIHTDDNQYGTATAMGHVDFYPNGGSKQPGCVTDIASCSHGRAVDLYEESINSKFSSRYCQSWDSYNTCSVDVGCYMGYDASAGGCKQNEQKNHYLVTNGDSPYCVS